MVRRIKKVTKDRATRKRKKIIVLGAEGLNKTEFLYFRELEKKQSQYHFIFALGNETDPVRIVKNTAKKAKELGFDYFTTTLSISPYKNSKWINEIGYELENKYNINYLYSDFKKQEGYKKSIELSKEFGLYRQEYCGCIYSLEEKDKNG